MVFEQEDKSQFRQALLLAGSNSKLKVFLNDDVINSTKYEKLRVIIHSKLNFSSHNNVMCKKTGQKMFAFSRITPLIELPKRHLLMHFSYVNVAIAL